MNIAKGVYHLPKKSKYGIVPPSDQEIVSTFVKNGKGMVVGYSLYNALNLTTQISKSIQIMSSTLESYTKTIRNVIVHQVPIEFSKEIQNMIKGLEVLQNFYEIQDLNYKAFIEFKRVPSLDINISYIDLAIPNLTSAISSFIKLSINLPNLLLNIL